MDHILICCVCLGDNSEDADEIIQCDNCGITVHEGNTIPSFLMCEESLYFNKILTGFKKKIKS